MSAPAPLATVDQVQARTEPTLTAEQRARAAVLLADAEAIVYAQVPDIGSPPPATAVGVVATAVLRAMASPADGIRSETVGGHTRTVAHAGGSLYFTEAELDLLRSKAPEPRGAFTIWTTARPGGGGGGG